jgi:hypothetical protein
LEHYKDHPKQQAFFLRISAFYFFANAHGLKALSKYTKASDEGPGVVLIHPAVMEAVATAPIADVLCFEKKSFLGLVDQLVRESEEPGSEG